jgi:hypothetical protein
MFFGKTNYVKLIMIKINVNEIIMVKIKIIKNNYGKIKHD